MLAGRPHQAAGNGSRRWMAVGPLTRVHRTRPTGRLARRHRPGPRKRSTPSVTVSTLPRVPSMRPAGHEPRRGRSGMRARQEHERAGTAMARLQRRVRELAERLDPAAELAPHRGNGCVVPGKPGHRRIDGGLGRCHDRGHRAGMSRFTCNAPSAAGYCCTPLPAVTRASQTVLFAGGRPPGAPPCPLADTPLTGQPRCLLARCPHRAERSDAAARGAGWQKTRHGPGWRGGDSPRSGPDAYYNA
jgi:hypothetical protein